VYLSHLQSQISYDMNGLIGKKIGMTSIFSEDGKNTACTIIEALPNKVVQVKSDDSDGYNSIQLGYGDAKEKNVTKPMKGHFAKAGVSPTKTLVEFRDSDLAKAQSIQRNEDGW